MPETPPVPANDNLAPAADAAVRAVRRSVTIDEMPDEIFEAIVRGHDTLKRSLPEEDGARVGGRFVIAWPQPSK